MDFEILEAELKNWKTDTRNAGDCVSGKSIQRNALEISNRRGLAQFKVSERWLRNFLRRNNYVLRRITSKGRCLPGNSLETINNFLSKCADETTGLESDEIWMKPQFICIPQVYYQKS